MVKRHKYRPEFDQPNRGLIKTLLSFISIAGFSMLTLFSDLNPLVNRKNIQVDSSSSSNVIRDTSPFNEKMEEFLSHYSLANSNDRDTLSTTKQISVLSTNGNNLQTENNRKERNVLGFDPEGTSAILDKPKFGKFKPSFNENGSYRVYAPLSLLKENGKSFLKFDCGSKSYGKKFNYEAVKFNLVLDGQIIASGMNSLGQETKIEIPDSLYHKLLDDKGKNKINFQVMALREIANTVNTKDYYIVASYNGVIDKIDEIHRGTESYIEITENPSMDLTKKISEDKSLDSLETCVNGYSLLEKTLNNLHGKNDFALIESYINSRNINNELLDNNTLNTWLDDFRTGIFEAADLYKKGIEKGLSHSQSLNYVIKNSSLASIKNKDSAYEALLLAQFEGRNDFVFSRFNSKLYDKKEIARDIRSMREEGLTYNEIRDNLRNSYKTNISLSTIRNYEKMYYA